MPRRTTFLPTHVERTPELAADGLRWLQEGGCVDLTAGKPVVLLVQLFAGGILLAAFCWNWTCKRCDT